MIALEHITKLYSQKTGIKDINLSFTEGTSYSIIGPNGAGKSTLLKILSGVLEPDEGVITISGNSSSSYERRNVFGYMPDNFSVSRRITTVELLRIISDYKHEGKYEEYIMDSLKRFQMLKYSNVKVEDLSFGNKKKVAMIIAFMGDNKAVILDEPTTGLDTYSIIQLKQLIIEEVKKGKIIVVASHILDFLRATCNIHFFIVNGRISISATSNENIEQIYEEAFIKNGRTTDKCKKYL